MEEIHKELQYEVLQGPLVGNFLTANQAFHLGGIIKVRPPGCAIFAEFRHHTEKIRNITVREDGVWVTTYPKGGEWKGKNSCSEN